MLLVKSLIVPGQQCAPAVMYALMQYAPTTTQEPADVSRRAAHHELVQQVCRQVLLH